MRSYGTSLSLAALLGCALAAPAFAGGTADRVYADSFGNLVVHNQGGDKRIIVGQGHLAKELAAYTGATVEDPDAAGIGAAAFAEPDQTLRVTRYYCRSHGVLIKGRGYMYGLEDGELPVLGCE